MKLRLYMYAVPLLLALANVMLAAGPVGTSWSGAAGHSSKADCADCCVATMEKVKVKRTCFEVECEPVCIPDVHIPWPWLAGAHGKGKADGCEQRCGKVRNVRVLTKRQYEETVCECRWSPVGKGGKWEAGDFGPETIQGESDVNVDHIPTPPVPGGGPADPTALRYFSDAR